MRVLIVSDTHRRHGNLELVIEKEQPFDLMIHLGDVETGEDYVRALVDCEVKMVCGNNDYCTELPFDLEFTIEGTRVFITHGHIYYVYRGLDKLDHEARERKADVVMYGHLHEPMIEERDRLTILSPGSISYPRQKGRVPSYIIMEVEQGKKAKYKLCFL